MIQTALQQFKSIDAIWWLIIMFAAALLLAFRHKNIRQVIGNVLIVYYLIVLASTVLSRVPVKHDSLAELINFNLVGTWIARLTGDASIRNELILNFLMLLPVGVLFPLSFCRKFGLTLLFGFLATVTIEVLQVLTGRGWFELVDIVDNTTGVAMGYGLFWVVSTMWKVIVR